MSSFFMRKCGLSSHSREQDRFTLMLVILKFLTSMYLTWLAYMATLLLLPQPPGHLAYQSLDHPYPDPHVQLYFIILYHHHSIQIIIHLHEPLWFHKTPTQPGHWDAIAPVWISCPNISFGISMHNVCMMQHKWASANIRIWCKIIQLAMTIDHTQHGKVRISPPSPGGKDVRECMWLYECILTSCHGYSSIRRMLARYTDRWYTLCNCNIYYYK